MFYYGQFISIIGINSGMNSEVSSNYSKKTYPTYEEVKKEMIDDKASTAEVNYNKWAPDECVIDQDYIKIDRD